MTEPLSPARQDLAARHLPLARSLARPFRLDFPGARDDFESAAALALVEAAGRFDPARNVKFATYARHRILGALIDVRRRLRAEARRRHLPDPARGRVHPHREGAGVVRVFLAPEPPVGSELERREHAESLMRKLPRRHAAACRELYLDGRNQAEAAARIGCSQSRISALRRESLAMLRAAR